jgi:serine kinase of HPr protein (carbohydrate metabolism regulator)
MPPEASVTITLHASAVVVGERAILIRGASGAGKSTVVAWATAVLHPRATLLADDRVLVALQHGRLVARPHAALAGALERRGYGIVTVSHAPAAVLGLVLDISPAQPDRMPQLSAQTTDILGVSLPRLELQGGPELGVALPATWAIACAKLARW